MESDELSHPLDAEAGLWSVRDEGRGEGTSVVSSDAVTVANARTRPQLAQYRASAAVAPPQWGQAMEGF